MSKTTKSRLTPKLRFPEFEKEGEWNEECLRILTNITIGEFVIKTKQHPNSPYPVYNGGRSYTGFYDDYNNEANRIVISARGANAGFVNLVKRKYWAGNSCYSVSIIEENLIDIEFLFYYIKENQTRFTNNQQAANIPSVSKADVQKFVANFPTNLIEQKKIASCLSSLDEVIIAENKKLDLFQDHKRGLLQNLFPQEGETLPKFRFKEFNKSWKKVKLKDVSLYFNGGSYENDVKEEGKYELISLKSINTNGQLISSKRFVDIEVPTLTKGTLVMILSEQAPGLLGMTAIIPTDNKYVLNQRVAEIRPNQEVESFFLSMAINRNQTYFSKHGAGMKVQNISKPNVQNYEFLIPEIQEQQKIATCLLSLDEFISAQNQKLNSLQFHKKGLLQGLFPNINEVIE